MSASWAVMMAGGRGTRFWPRSRRSVPKQCLDLDGGGTLLRQTVDRVLPLVGPGRVLVVTGRDMEAAVREQLPDLPRGDILVEPEGRGTGPCLAWAGAEVRRRGGDALVALPSDHRVERPDDLRQVLAAALGAARDTGSLVLLGMSPDRPETGFGWIVPGEVVEVRGEHALHRVLHFVEKPPAHRARALLERGALWNAGIFAWTIEAFQSACARHLPATHRAMAELVRGRPVEEVFRRMEPTSVDRGLLEREPDLLVAPCDPGWSDLGTWEALGRILPRTDLGPARVDAAVAIEGGGHLVYAPGKLVVSVGVSGLLLVDTGDAILLCARDQADRLPEVVDLLERRGLGDWL